MDHANDGDPSAPSHHTEDEMDVDPVDDSDSDGRALRSVAKVDYAAMLGGLSSPPKKRKTHVQPDVNADFTIPAAEVATEEVSETLEDARIEPFLSSVPCAYDTLPACGLFEDKLTTLDIDEIREVERSEETFTFHGPHGEPYDITPGQHTNLRDTTPNDANPHDLVLSPLQKVQAFFASAKKSYVGDTPLHVARPQESVFAIFSQSDFDKLPPAHVQDILRKQHIVTTDESITPLGFDRAALRAVHPLNAPVTVQDLSIPGDDFNVRLKEGTLAQVLQNSHNPNGKILNALQFPKPMDGLFRAPYSSSSAALDETVGAPDFKPEMAFDAGSLSWRIVGGKNAVHFWHIDCDGLGTMVQVLGGSNGGAKLWIVARPKGKLYDCGLFGSLQTFLREGFELDDPSDGPWAGADDMRWELEAIVLRPGSTLIMRPNTPHAVYTPVPTICHGVHFYATSTMQDTLFGIVHTLVAGTYITNTQHITARRLIHRLVDLYHRGIVERTVDEESPAYAHIPSLQTPASAMDLITTCVLAILGNVLDTRTYLAPGASTAEPTEAQTQIYMQWDANEIHTFDRKAHVLARGKAYSIIREMNSRVEFVTKDGVVMDVESIVRAYLLQVCQAVMQYKELAESKEYEVMGASNCTKQLIMRQLRGLNNPQSSFQYIQVGDIGPGLAQTTLAFPFVNLTIRHISNAKAPEKVIDYMRSGVSRADALFHLGCNPKNRKDNPWKGIDPLGEKREGDNEASDEHDGEDNRPPRKRRKTRSS
ncbi:hypothetical protein NLJ89_g11200 [Agrocybe chaxingu]|uniref:JmjC domain-containing protein n=1 Tax=Agrocybe chaxingu TaxID=84603 RepID=A0A9W8MRD7_9AGAR|nr:hypothetical protein NLJ89_g11200 [Agrocybe chaxingu]